MSETQPGGGPQSPFQGSTRLYVIIAAALVVVIVVIVVLLITVGLPALRGDAEPTAVAEAPTATPVPTFTPGPTKAPTDTPPPPPTPTLPPFMMTDDYAVLYAYESAGARPSSEWTGFFGWVRDAEDNPMVGVPLIVLYPEGIPVELEGVPTSPVVMTDADGYYEIQLARAPFAGTWSILVLADDRRPASDFLTFRTDEDTETGIQQIQVIWKQVP